MGTEVWLCHSAREGLYDDFCPYCDGDLEYGVRFQDEEGRYGGSMACPHCRLLIKWIDSPFKVTVEHI